MRVVSEKTARRLGCEFIRLTADRVAVHSRCRARWRGLGDVVEWFARKTGLARVAKTYERATGKPCGCAQRQAKLNELAPFS